MRVAIVHHWFVTKGGGERVAECIASLFPEAEIFTLVADAAGIPETLRGRKINTSFLQKIPLAKRYHRHMMPFYPLATKGLDLRGFDLVISSDSGPIKGVRVDPGAYHICYCHSPMRYLYDGYETYRSHMGPLTRALFTATAARVRRSDKEAASRVTEFIANSVYVAERIQRIYGRQSTIIHPPIDVHRGTIARESASHYLCAGRLVGYKQTHLMMEACARLGRTLRVAGTGPEMEALRRLKLKDVVFLGEMTTDALWQEYSHCRALLFCADEDFGMVPLEAQACGRPVIAYGVGGSLETVQGAGADRTGVFFAEQSVEAVMQAIVAFEDAEARGEFIPERIQRWALSFDTSIFIGRLRSFLEAAVPGVQNEMIQPSARNAAMRSRSVP